jgi:hypothetical protein
MFTTLQTPPADWLQDSRKVLLDKRIAALFWALMFILAGAIWLFPDARIPNGTWLIGIGAILLSLNVVRLVKGIPVHVLPSVLGVLALGAGLAAYVGLELPLVALTLIAIGASIILESLTARRT